MNNNPANSNPTSPPNLSTHTSYLNSQLCAAGAVARGRPLTDPERLAVRRLAILRSLHLGDLLLAVPAFRAIRQGFPNAEITLIGLPWSEDFVRRFPHYLDRWREFPGYPGLLEVDVDPARTETFLNEERAYRYDLVLQMHGNGSVSNRFALDLAAKSTVGYYQQAPPEGLTLGAPYPDHLPELLRHLGIVRLLGLPDDDRRMEFPILPEDDAALAEVIPNGLFAGTGPLVGLHPGARPPARRWPPEYFAAVGDALAERYGARIVVTGGPGEGGIAPEIIRRMRHPAVSLAEKTSIGSLAALIRHYDLIVSNDTGPAHIAVALDRPSITIFGPADRRRWAPLDQTRHPIAFQPVECSPCPHWECPIDHRCLRRVTPEQVLEIAARLLNAREAGTSEGSCAA
ncbi:MAG TPA: glycosyltransferase family 9 protein [Chloroflexota bacterium]|nr:glycosyltransferase family 9 protein [Chloroflexota bacterium]